MWIVILLVIAAALFYASCAQSGKDARKEERDHPCESCQRWGECNGVDENCPWRCEDGN